MRFFFPFVFGGLVAGLAAAEPTDVSRRFFDFTPVSEDNPVVATIDAIEVPLSELRAFRESERLNAITDPKSRPQKRAVLDDLISEYLYVDEAHRTGVLSSSGFVRQMEATRTMVLTDFMATRLQRPAAEAATASASEGARELGDRLFEAAEIRISNEAFAVFTAAVKAIDVATAASSRGPVVDSPDEAKEKLRAIIDQAPDPVIVSYEGKSIQLRQLLVIYAGQPTPRPVADTQDGFVALIKPMIVPELLALEAVKRGIAAEPEFQAKLIQNRNALLRFHMQGVMERQTGEFSRAADAEKRLRAFYEANKTQYTVTNENGEKRERSYEELAGQLEGDFSVAELERIRAEKAAELRRGRKIVVYDEVLDRLE